MEQLYIQQAFEKELNRFDPDTPKAYENKSFTPTEQPYMRIKLTPQGTENPSIGDNFYREVGQYVIFLCYPLNTGTAAAKTKAHAIRDHFKRSTTLVEQGLTVQVSSTPQIAGGLTTDDRYVVPVIIEYFANVLKV